MEYLTPAVTMLLQQTTKKQTQTANVPINTPRFSVRRIETFQVFNLLTNVKGRAQARPIANVLYQYKRLNKGVSSSNADPQVDKTK